MTTPEAVTVIDAISRLIVPVATLLGVAGSIWMSYRNSKKIEVNNSKIEVVRKVTEQVHDATNSKMDELKQIIEKAAFARGNLAGRAELKAEQSGDPT